MSPDAQKILALPHVHMPSLREAVHMMASIEHMTITDAIHLLDVVCRSAGITQLDLEMCVPEMRVSVPFAATASNPDPQSQQQEAIGAHLRLLLNRA